MIEMKIEGDWPETAIKDIGKAYSKIKITNINSVRSKNTRKIVCPECKHELEIPHANRSGDYFKWAKYGECKHEITI